MLTAGDDPLTKFWYFGSQAILEYSEGINHNNKTVWLTKTFNKFAPQIVNIIQLFSSSVISWQNKLECLSLAGFQSSLSFETMVTNQPLEWGSYYINKYQTKPEREEHSSLFSTPSAMFFTTLTLGRRGHFFKVDIQIFFFKFMRFVLNIDSCYNSQFCWSVNFSVIVTILSFFTLSPF